MGNVHIANVVAPAIFGERAILQPGSSSAALVRSCTVAECMILPPTSAAVPIIRARLLEDIGRLERMLEKKMALTRTQLASTEDLTKAADQQDKGLCAGGRSQEVEIDRFIDIYMYIESDEMYKVILGRDADMDVE